LSHVLAFESRSSACCAGTNILSTEFIASTFYRDTLLAHSAAYQRVNCSACVVVNRESWAPFSTCRRALLLIVLFEVQSAFAVIRVLVGARTTSMRFIFLAL